MLFNTLKPMCPLLKQLAKLIENYKINKAKVQGNGHKNLAKGLQKILGFLGLDKEISVKDKNVFTIRTYKLYIYCIDNLYITPDSNNMAELDEERTNIFSEHLSHINHKNAKLVVKARKTVVYFDKENIVVFPNGNFITDKVYYNDSKNEYKLLEDVPIKEDYIKSCKEYTDEILDISNSIVVYDYFNKDEKYKNENEIGE